MRRFVSPVLITLFVVPTADRAVAADVCPACVVDLTVTREAGPPTTAVHTFPADPAERHRLTIEMPGGGSPVWVALNGETLFAPPQSTGGSGRIVIEDLRLPPSNTLRVTLAGRPGRRLRVRIEATASGGLQSCPPWIEGTEPLFTHPLVPMEQLEAIEPLGRMTPPIHTLPTHHTYWNGPTALDGSGRPLFTGLLDVRAPSAVRLVALTYAEESDDFKVALRPCLEVQLYIDHVKRLAPAVQAAFETGRRYDFPGGTVALLDLRLAPGDAIGIGGGARFEDGRPDGSIGIDVGLIDLRRPERPFANPERYRLPDSIDELLPPGIPPEDAALIVRDLPPQRLYQFCPVDYFPPALADQYRARLGAYLGARRTVEPVCGDLVQDVAGTLQGGWFEDKPANGFGPDFSNDSDESRLLAFAPDHVDPAVLVMSIGQSVESPDGSPFPWAIPAGTYVFGTPATEGTANRAFAAVVAGATYCYEGVRPHVPGSPPLAGVILVEVGPAELWIARSATTPACTLVPPELRLSDAPAARRYVR